MGEVQVCGILVMAIVVMASLISAAVFATGPAYLMVISNQFASAEILVQCESRTEHLATSTVSPHRAYTFNFDPTTQEYFHCVVATSPTILDPSKPPLQLWGRFYLYVRNPLFRPCFSPPCLWVVNEDGLSLVLKPGDHPRPVYGWPPYPGN